ncbi:MAG: class I SAM-dependent methyltransferase [Alphaproteobacteria bacterium]|jgi:SAM-dependent methyltransferase|nr:class I SAM-dependent methyltransferase [Alphaproteobacteria bacterium]MDP6237788.1 class I SAM-dependent methyltransferase [Alphaproteobacteria bacterium]MDP7174235.1 class I SAM-dependent methyltransferase [Alphaproteobacteria bacterium]MDP7234297.1 class I SAM-dependent methyltransferase [Alphaproteobacteria bacterium]MDP7488851.1 class I SAM-dependent methyltransferase [Alphaproteobacteria bacterium]|tara:strand:- start:8372 stop:8983 length:612 start_codon:yes stop_codon:yes gene_type:complete
MDEDDKHQRWKRYYASTSERPPRKTLLLALERFRAEGLHGGCAIDLGCGSGRDTIALLRLGWRVLAIDAEPEAFAALGAREDLPVDAALETRINRFEDEDLPPADLINSSFALPLVPPQDFPRLWQNICGALRPGGRVSTQFFGPKDEWHGDPTITFHTRAEAEARLDGLEVEMLDEEEDESPTPRGKTKHWHLFHIVARRAP